MRVVFKSGIFLALVGLCFSAPLLRMQITNPTYAILSLEQYRAYYAFYGLGPRLDTFARLGTLAGALLLSYFALWCARRVGLLRYLRYSSRGEAFSWPWRTVAVLSTLCLGLLLQLGWLTAVAVDLMTHQPGAVHHLLLAALGLTPALLLWKMTGPLEHRLLRGPLLALVVVGGGLAALAGDLARQFYAREFLVPPVVSTHYGPWGMLAWITGLGLCLGLAFGIVMLGITPEPGAEPDSPTPIPRSHLSKALSLSLILAFTLLGTYPLFLVPNYQLGQDLVRVLSLQRSTDPGRTVVWLDSHDPPHRIEPFETWSTPSNLEKVEDWITHAPSPSALTRPAAKMLGDQALYQWRPLDALDWLEVHRRRQHFSNLNRAFLEVLGSTVPSPRGSGHLEALIDPNRFAWPGPGSRLQLAAQLRRYGRRQRALAWEREAQKLGGGWLPSESAAIPEGSIGGRLLRDGKPLAGIRIALFHGNSERELLERTRAHVQGERSLMTAAGWRPSYYQYLDFERLRNFYAVAVTDADGHFLFEPLDEGIYRVAARLSTPAELEGSRDLIVLGPGQHLNLGGVELRSGL